MHVDPVGANRVGDDLVDVRNRSQVNDRIATARSPSRGGEIGDVADHLAHRSWVVVPGLHVVEDHGLVPGVRNRIDDVRADEAGAARDEDSHRAAAWRPAWIAGR